MLLELQVVLEGVFEQAPVPRPGPLLHRLRGRGRRQAHQEDGGLPPVPRRQRGGRGDAAGGRARACERASRKAGRYEAGREARRRARRPARRRGLAHAGLGQEPDHGLLRRADDPRIRRWRTRRSSSSPTATTSTTSSSAPSPAASDLLRQEPVQAADRADLREKLRVGGRRRGLHHDPEVHARGEGRPPPGALGPAQHRRHRRRGPPQPVRLHRRLRPAHARRPAERLASSASPARRSRRPTRTRGRSSATTSASTTSSARSRTGPRCRSTTRAGWPSWS